jgi:hypothetical protein
MPFIETTQPASLAVNLQDLKDNLRQTSSDEDSLIQFYAEAAIDLFEKYTERRLINRSVRHEQSDFPMESDDCGIELPVGPLSSVTNIQYYETNGILTTWNSGNYVLDTTSHFPRIRLAPSINFPVVQDDRHNGVQINFVAGYGATYTSVPKGIQWAVILMASEMFTKRLPVEKIPDGLAAVVSPYKLRRA